MMGEIVCLTQKFKNSTAEVIVLSPPMFVYLKKIISLTIHVYNLKYYIILKSFFHNHFRKFYNKSQNLYLFILFKDINIYNQNLI